MNKPEQGDFSQAPLASREGKVHPNRLDIEADVLRRLAGSLSDIVFRADLNTGLYEYVSLAAEEITGYPLEEQYATPFFVRKIIDLNWISVFEDMFAMTLKGINPGEFEFPVITSTGKRRWLSQRTNLIMVDGKPKYLEGVVRDVTERKAAEDQLLLFRKLVHSSSEGIVVRDLDMKLVYANQAYLDIFGMTLEEALAAPMASLYTKTSMERHVLVARENLLAGKSWEGYQNCLRRDGEPFVMWARLDAILDGSGRVTHGFGIVHDATERIRTAKDLAKTRDELEKRVHKRTKELNEAVVKVEELNRELILIQERERRSLALDLHDNVAQNLGSLKIAFEVLFDEQPELSAPTRQRREDLSELIQECLDSVRGMAYGLRPPGLDRLGLAHALRQLCEDLEKGTDIEMDFSTHGMEGVALNGDVSINLYRIAQEGLANVRRHAGARNVIVRLVASHPNIILRIEDDGKGFDVDARPHQAAQERRMGLRSMEERVRILDGSLRLTARPDIGTRIVVEIPCLN